MLFPLLYLLSFFGIVLLIGVRAWQLRVKRVSFYHADTFHKEKEWLALFAARARSGVNELRRGSAVLVLWFVRVGKRMLGVVEQKLVTAKPMEEVFGKRSLRYRGSSSPYLQEVYRHKKEVERGVIHE